MLALRLAFTALVMALVVWALLTGHPFGAVFVVAVGLGVWQLSERALARRH